METTQVSRLRKNWIVCFQPINFEKISDQPIRAKHASAYAGWRDNDTTVASRCGVHFQKSFLKNFQIFLGILSDANQNNQSGRFPVLQQEEFER